MSRDVSLSFEQYEAILRNHFSTFIQRSFYELNPQGEFVPGQYIELVAAALEECRIGQTKRLIINLPPRTLKSHAATVAFPAWLLGHDPTIQIITVSYGQILADELALNSRTLMQSPFYRRLFPRTMLSPVKNSVNHFMTTQHGVRMATSVGGVLTGLGADVIILDDPMKSDDALSEARRRATNEWYFNSLLSRLNSKQDGIIIIVMQRLHQEDLVGEVLDRGDWKVLSLPAIAIDDERIEYEGPLGKGVFERKAGEALHPVRESIQTLLNTRESSGEYTFQSQYQQSPTSRDGGLVKREWFRYYDPEQVPEHFSYVLQSWDTACKADEMNDFSVCGTWALANGEYYLLDVYRARLTYPQLKRAVDELYRKFRPDKVLIEDKSSGIALIQELKADGVFDVEAYKPDPGSDKIMRFGAQSIKFEAGKVLLPRQADWLDNYEREITGFPGTKHDDQVDSTSQALDFLGTKARAAAVWESL